jgi:hypothetical protein
MELWPDIYNNYTKVRETEGYFNWFIVTFLLSHELHWWVCVDISIFFIGLGSCFLLDMCECERFLSASWKVMMKSKILCRVLHLSVENPTSLTMKSLGCLYTKIDMQSKGLSFWTAAVFIINTFKSSRASSVHISPAILETEDLNCNIF